MQEKIRRKDKVDLDMAVVEELKSYQKQLNHYLRGTKYQCTLHPKSDLFPCCSCSRFKLCNKHKREREYIESNKESYTTSKRRERKEEKGKMRSETMDYHEAKGKVYPCEPFDFCCPDKDKCNEGQNCSFKER